MSEDESRELAELRSRVVELEEQLAGRTAPQPDRAQTAKRPRALTTARAVHRTAAVAVGLFLLLMGITGIILSHTDALGLQPLMVQLHAGLFVGPYAWVYCDLVGLALVALSVTGIILYAVPRHKSRSRNGG